MLRSYAVQETVGPLRGLGRYLLFGLIGAVGVSLGVVFGALALVRVLQAETGVFNANWSFVPHVAGAAFLLLAIALLVRAIRPERHASAAKESAQGRVPSQEGSPARSSDSRNDGAAADPASREAITDAAGDDDD